MFRNIARAHIKKLMQTGKCLCIGQVRLQFVQRLQQNPCIQSKMNANFLQNIWPRKALACEVAIELVAVQ